MKKMKKSKFYILIICTLLSSCADLDIENENRADIDRVLTNPQEFGQLIESQYLPTWKFSQDGNSSLALDHAADGFTGAAVSFNITNLSKEPRIAIDNTPLSFTATFYLTRTFGFVYSPLGTINEVLKVLENDSSIQILDQGKDITSNVKMQGLYLQGVCYGNLSMLFDKGQFVDENTDLSDISTLPFSSYKELADNAVKKLQMAIDEAEMIDEFTITGYNGVTLSKEEFIRLVRTMQTRVLTNNARDEAENQNNDWVSILNYASQGIQKDLIITDDNVWRDSYKGFSARTPWSYVDYRVVSMLDPTQPSKFPTDGSHPLAPATSLDKRLTTYMSYTPNIDISASDGLYRYSHYKFTRYVDISTGGSIAPYILKAENDLIWAEALIRTNGDKILAANLINNTRVANGNLSSLLGTENDQELLDAISYERIIELLGSYGGNTFYTRRRLPADNGSLSPLKGLQMGTFKNYPIPAPELVVLGAELYTFGG